VFVNGQVASDPGFPSGGLSAVATVASWAPPGCASSPTWRPSAPGPGGAPGL